jgi:hypothetical protein
LTHYHKALLIYTAFDNSEGIAKVNNNMVNNGEKEKVFNMSTSFEDD